MIAITKDQLKKLNKKINLKYSEINVTFTLYGVLQVKYTELYIIPEDTYFYQLWNSLISNSSNFEDIYYSI